jgi:hypothetical protein
LIWIPIETPLEDGRNPKNAGVLLLKGTLDRSTLTQPGDEMFPRQTVRTVGYWDSLDEAWALTTTPWYGPFFNPTHYAVFPDSLDL